MKFRWFIWIPRVLMIIFILFVMLFSLDSFGGDKTLGEQLLGFFIHNIPAFVLIITLILTWKRPFYGGVFFIMLAIFLTFFWSTYRMLPTFLIFTLVPLFAGFLFLFAHYCKKKQMLSDQNTQTVSDTEG
jgi:hypothetical protein